MLNAQCSMFNGKGAAYYALFHLSNFLAAVGSCGLHEDYAPWCAKGTLRLGFQLSPRGVVGRDIADIVAFDGEEVALADDIGDELGAILDVALAGHVAEVDLVPFANFGGEDDGVVVNYGDGSTALTASGT